MDVGQQSCEREPEQLVNERIIAGEPPVRGADAHPGPGGDFFVAASAPDSPKTSRAAATIRTQLRRASRRRPRGSTAAREAVGRTGLDDPLVASALDQIATGEPRTNAGLQEVAGRLDQVAWDIPDGEDEHDSERYMVAFRGVRAASAVAFALDADIRSMLESIYEAQAALRSIAAARRVTEPLLTNDWGTALRHIRLSTMPFRTSQSGQGLTVPRSTHLRSRQGLRRAGRR
jgi:hypothetical protein